MILTPKIVRETSGQVFWLSLLCRPSHPDGSEQWILSGKSVDPASCRAGITAAGPLPIYTGFPSPGCVRYVIVPALYHTPSDKVKTYPRRIMAAAKDHLDEQLATVFLHIALALAHPIVPEGVMEFQCYEATGASYAFSGDAKERGTWVSMCSRTAGPERRY